MFLYLQCTAISSLISQKSFFSFPIPHNLFTRLPANICSSPATAFIRVVIPQKTLVVTTHEKGVTSKNAWNHETPRNWTENESWNSHINRATLWSHTHKVSYLCNSKLSYMLSQPLKKLCISTMLFTYLLRCNDFTITWRIQLNLVCAKVSVSLPDDEWSTLSYCRSLSSRKLQKKEKEVNLLTRT